MTVWHSQKATTNETFFSDDEQNAILLLANGIYY